MSDDARRLVDDRLPQAQAVDRLAQETVDVVTSRPPATREQDPAAGAHRIPDAVVLVALLATCAGIYLTVGEAGFAGVISAVAALYGTWRARR
ncbi:hypothetical protein ACIQZO_39265 [Streptomyces sp. NPDC097617]|uniref:hypothetical protein n=1 Tax=Streptomyces sp. NPDC097617 TaxID=3366091 RepID=UPI0037FDAFFC